MQLNSLPLHLGVLGVLLTGSALFAATTAPEDRLIIADFEDVGTWRAREISGVPPEGWFSGTISLSSSNKEQRRGNYVGELDYLFGGKPPYEISLEREKMSRPSAFIHAIEFEAKSNGTDVALAFDLEDSNGRRFRSTKLPLQGESWKTYRLDINAQTMPRFSEIQFPAVLRKIYFTSTQPGAGRIFIDDLRLIGRVSRAQKISIFPVYQGISYAPEKPVELTYRLRNAATEKIDTTVTIKSNDVRGGEERQQSQKISLPATGETEVTFKIGTLPIGSYTVRITVDGGEIKASYFDLFGVFTPNDKRLNKKPMWFGLQDSTTWQGESENALHREWMKKLGVDLIRVGIAGLWTEPVRDQPLNPALATMLQQLGDAGLDTYLLYSDAVPTWTMTPHVWRKPPTDWAAFDEHIGHLGTYLAAIPSVKYLEMWNEPDLDFYKGNLEDYIKMLKSFSVNFKATSPNIKLVSGGLTVLHPAEKKGFSKAVVQQAALCDVTGFHNHGPVSSYIERQKMVEGWLKESGIDHPIANTEAGARSYYDDLNGALAQAIALVQKITYAKSRPTTEFYTWYLLQDYWDMDSKADDSLGLVTSDNRAKPSFLAYNELIHRLANTEPQGEVTLHPDLISYCFKRTEDGKLVYVCWPKQGRASARVWIKATGPYIRSDIFGREEKLATDKGSLFVPIGQLPLYLQSTKADDKLQSESPGMADFTVPESLFLTNSKTDVLPVQLHNRSKTTSSYIVTLLDETGIASGTQKIELESQKDATLSIPVTFPVPENYQLRNSLVKIQVDGAAPREVQLPVELRSPYPIMRVNSADQVSNAPTLVLSKAEDVRELAFDPFIPQWRGPDDLSMKARLAHDGKTLFLQFDVTDSQHVQNNPVSEMWKGDSVQMALTDPQGKMTEITLGLTKNGPAVFCDESPTASLKGAWTVPVKITREGKITTYRAEIPLKNFGITFANARLPLRLALVLNNNNGQGRIRYMQWFSGLATNKDIEAFGYATLETATTSTGR